VDFLELAIAKQENKFEIFNVGVGSSVSVGNLVEKIISYSGKNIKIEYDTTKPTVKTKIFLDTSKAQKHFGWSPKISIDEGIKKTLDWYRDNIKLI
jgi:GDP-L-fucose synthase